MLSPEKIFNEIKNNDDAFRLFISTASKGEYQGGWENERIAELTEDPEFSERIRNHGRDESKHGRLFEALLKKRNMTVGPVPPSGDYCVLLEQRGIGLSHERLGQNEKMTPKDHLKYLVHSRVTEQRAQEEIELQRKVFANDPELKKTLDIIANDEVNHLSYCHEELKRFQDLGFGEEIDRMLKRYALVEIRTYKDVSLTFIDWMSSLLGWERLKKGAMKMGVYFIYTYERIWGWRRMVTIHQNVYPRDVVTPVSVEVTPTPTGSLS